MPPTPSHTVQMAARLARGYLGDIKRWARLKGLPSRYFKRGRTFRSPPHATPNAAAVREHQEPCYLRSTRRQALSANIAATVSRAAALSTSS